MTSILWRFFCCFSFYFISQFFHDDFLKVFFFMCKYREVSFIVLKSRSNLRILFSFLFDKTLFFLLFVRKRNIQFLLYFRMHYMILYVWRKKRRKINIRKKIIDTHKFQTLVCCLVMFFKITNTMMMH